MAVVEWKLLMGKGSMFFFAVGEAMAFRHLILAGIPAATYFTYSAL